MNIDRIETVEALDLRTVLGDLEVWLSHLRMDTDEDQAITDKFVGLLHRLADLPLPAAGLRVHEHAYVLTDVRERTVCRCGAVEGEATS